MGFVTGTPSVCMHPVDALHGDMGVISPYDAIILFSNSGKTGELIKLLSHLPATVTTVAVTAREDSPLAKKSHFWLPGTGRTMMDVDDERMPITPFGSSDFSFRDPKIVHSYPSERPEATPRPSTFEEIARSTDAEFSLGIKTETVDIGPLEFEADGPDGVPAPTTSVITQLGISDALALCLMRSRIGWGVTSEGRKREFSKWHPGGALGGEGVGGGGR